MKLILLVALLPALLAGQVIEIGDLHDPAPLAGEWKIQSGDNPAWAAPDFDDSGWQKVRMPRAAHQNPTSAFWLRFVISLREPLPAQDLYLLIGPQFSAYEVYANGTRAGHFGGDLGNWTGLHVARPASYPLPRSPRLAIAIRVGKDELPLVRPGSGAARATSYLGTRSGVEGITARLDRDRHQQTLLPRMLCLMLACAGLLFLGLYATRRSNLEYLFCGLIFLCASYHRLLMFAPEAITSARWVFSASTVLTDPLFSMCAVLFPVILLRLRPRWVEWLIGCLYAGSGVLANMPGTGGVFALRSFALLPMLVFSLAYTAGRAGRKYVSSQGAWPILLVFGLFWISNNAYFIASYLRGVFFQDEFPITDVLLRFPILLLAIAMIFLLNQRASGQDREQARLQQEMDAAAQVQDLLLSNQNVPGVEAVYLPATEVGGDFYHVTEKAGARLVVVGDVSGKGLKAAMLASVIIGALRCTKSMSPAVLLGELNEVLLRRIGGGFATCCCTRFDPDGSLTIANAGHPAPYCDGREVAELEAGLPLGIAPEAQYLETVLRGERVAMVSDGVVEAANAQGELFGFERTREISTKPAAVIAEAARAWGQNDDITVVTVRRTA